MIRGAIFDLDGTLLNTVSALQRSMNLTLKEFGLPEISEGEVKKYVGNGSLNYVIRSLRRFGKEDPELVRMEIDIVREKCQQLQPEKNIKIVKIDDRAGIIRERERRDAQKAKEKRKAQKAKDRRKGNTSGKRTGRQNQKPSGRR